MNERHECSLRPRSRLLVNEPNPTLAQLSKRSANVLDPQRDVVQTRSATIEKARDGRFRRRGLEQLESGFSNRYEMRPNVLRSNFFGRIDFQAEAIAEKGEGRSQIAHSNPDMVENSLHSRRR
jgi:hypothetical protein